MTDSLKLALYSQCDLRVGRVFECEKHPSSDKLYVILVDIGDAEGPRTIVCPLQTHYSIDALICAEVIVFSNIQEKQVSGILSNGIILMTRDGDGNNGAGKIELIRPEEGS